MSPARQPATPEPRGRPAVGWAGLVLAVVVLAAGALLLRAALVAAGVVSGWGLMASTLKQLDGLGPSAWMGAVGVGVVLLGLGILLVALGRRPRRYRELGEGSGVYAHRRVVNRRAAHEAGQVSGVLAAEASLHRRMDMRITTTGGGDVREAATEAASDAVSAIYPRPSVVVRARAASSGGAAS